MKEDDYTKRWTQFDVESRLQRTGATKDELLEFAANQTLKWTESEKTKISSILKEIDTSISKQGFNLKLPSNIFLIKTTCQEEAGAGGYTRQNYIVLRDKLINESRSRLKETLIHELYHVLSRHDSVFRAKSYSVIGFSISNEVSIPDNIAGYRITNPDAVRTDSSIRLKIGRKPVECLMFLYSKRNYRGGELFDYLKVGFLKLVGDPVKSVELKKGRAKIYSLRKVRGFFQQVGKNTDYIIDPEEIVAENFVFAVLNKSNLPNQEIIDRLSSVLKEL